MCHPAAPRRNESADSEPGGLGVQAQAFAPHHAPISSSLASAAGAAGDGFSGPFGTPMRSSGGSLEAQPAVELLFRHAGVDRPDFDTAPDLRAEGSNLNRRGVAHIFASRRWRVVGVDEKRKVIEVLPSPGGRVPAFKGERGDVHDRLRQEMRPVYVGSTVRLLLAEAGHIAQTEGPCIRVSASEADTLTALRQIASQPRPDPLKLSTAVKNKWSEKHDSL
jgi:hypothetical protein